MDIQQRFMSSYDNKKLDKWSNEELRNCLQQYTGKDILTQSIFKQLNVRHCNQKTMEK